MAASLLAHGHEVAFTVHRNRDGVDALAAKGAREVIGAAGLAASSDAILICVTTSNIVERQIEALKPHLRKAMIVLDAGTSLPEVTRRIAGDLAGIGVSYADIPLTGGPEQAARGELGVLCGADDHTFRTIESLLKSIATTVRHMGPVGSGHTAKLISNFLVTGMAALVAQSFAAARAAGLEWKPLYEAMLNGSGNSGVLRKMVAPALSGDFDGYKFSVANAAKDIGYYRDLAAKLGCDGELAEAVALVFAKALETGDGGRCVSQMLNH
ncbi:MAG: NAD(P)-dependent oxidoreductase [Rhizobiales bacterium]|nr:NAD(P)-dependent oxidoreductase [Hyphomicrobiales bacterium]